MATGNDDQNIGLAREILTVIFGLDQTISDRVIRTIKNSQHITDIKTNLIRMRVGARSMRYLRNAVEIARHEGSEKHVDDKIEPDKRKEMDLEPKEFRQEHHRKTMHDTGSDEADPNVRETVTFKGYLLNEVTMNIDPESPDAMSDFRQNSRLMKTSPERYNRQKTVQAKKDRVAATASDTPTAQVDAQIAQLRIRIAQLERRRINIMKQEER